ncbi:MAG: peptidylprolyl isomerase [Actinomycetales bacterium]|nr:peptidylprolyl isomerase [Actinomycetales bacterium]
MSSSNKRERELARKKYERQQERRQAREAQQHRRNQVLAVVAGLVVVGGAVIALVYSSRGDSTPTASATSSPSATASASASTSASASASASPTASAKDCTTAPTPTTKTQTWSAPGGSPLPTDKPTYLRLATNCGDVVIQMDAKAAPKTTQSMAFLAAQGYYSDSGCFRLTTQGIFVLQCGSPTNDGQGGPGYQLPDENLPASGTNNYPAGTVAMANAGAGTGGSQFFIVYKDTTLGPSYSIWGKVVSGLDVVQKVAAAGVQGGGGDGAPNQKTVITKATTSTTQAG